MNQILLHSHNDYWCQHPLWDAIAYGCNKVEAYIIYFNKKCMISHSWRHLAFMYYGKLEKTYFSPLYNYCSLNPDNDMWMHIEFKDSGVHIIPLLYTLFRKYNT